MTARRKRKKSKTKRISFKPGTSKRKKKRQASRAGPSLIRILKILAVAFVVASAAACIVVGIVAGFSFLEKYVKETTPISEQTIRLELANVPAWVNDQLKQKVLVAARGDGEDLRLDENAAGPVQQNIAREVVWLDEVTVQRTHDGFRIEGRWRRPVGLIKSGLSRFYVDAEQVVLDFLAMPHLPIVNITGLPLITKIPPLGEVWGRDDLAAPIEIIKRLEQMDKLVTPDKPLLYEIDRVDVSNFNGRVNSKLPHIVMYAKDNTQIIWGAEVGKWQRYLESTDEQKLAKLYGYYKEYGTLSGGAKYINLRDPQDNIPLPIDKY
ncbi:MAG: hypothetical protein ACETWQ_06835 [Phycisphaerae bacterium]